MNNGPQNVPMKDTEKLIGRFVVLYRNDVKTPAKVIGVNKADRRIVYELMGGTDKGKQFSSKFDESQMAFVYDDSNVMLALLET